MILVITPRIVRSVNPPQLAKHTLWSGTANQYNTQPLFSANRPGTSSLDSETGAAVSNPAGWGSSEPSEAQEADQESVDPDPEDSEESSPGVSRLQVIPAAASLSIGEEISLTLQGQNFSSAEQTSMTITYDPDIVSL